MQGGHIESSLLLRTLKPWPLHARRKPLPIVNETSAITRSIRGSEDEHPNVHGSVGMHVTWSNRDAQVAGNPCKPHGSIEGQGLVAPVAVLVASWFHPSTVRPLQVDSA
jgi:hypothetical protein